MRGHRLGVGIRVRRARAGGRTLSHCPSCAHAAHDSSVSLHDQVQVPHESGQVIDMKSALDTHSPSLAHAPQLSLLSLQMPARAAGSTSATAKMMRSMVALLGAGGPQLRSGEECGL